MPCSRRQEKAVIKAVPTMYGLSDCDDCGKAAKLACTFRCITPKHVEMSGTDRF